MKKLLIIGTGETARLAYNYFIDEGKYEIQAFLVDSKYLVANTFCGLDVHPLEQLGKQFTPDDFKLFVALGSGHLNRDRTRLYNHCKTYGFEFANYISPQVDFMAKDVIIGQNCFILEGNTLQSGVSIGDNVTLWSGNHIGHCTKIEENCFVSSHCVISGFVVIGANSFLGVNCTIEQNSLIGKDNFIGASVLIRGTTENNSVYQAPMPEPSKVAATRLFRVKL